VFRGARRQSVKIGVSKSKRINVAGQDQPKYFNIQPHGQYHALKTQRIGYAAFNLSLREVLETVLSHLDPLNTKLSPKNTVFDRLVRFFSCPDAK